MPKQKSLNGKPFSKVECAFHRYRKLVLYLLFIFLTTVYLVQPTKIGHFFHLNATNCSHRNHLDTKDTRFGIFFQQI